MHLITATRSSATNCRAPAIWPRPTPAWPKRGDHAPAPYPAQGAQAGRRGGQQFDKELERIDANALIDAGNWLLDDALAAVDRSVARIGDCVAPRTIAQAVLEGRRWAQAMSLRHQ